jgi:5-deoxy-glucuronate isomerase
MSPISCPRRAGGFGLLVVEVITPAGNTSSYPPHKHDQDDLPRESLLEETYYHRLSPPQGFGFQRVYTDDRSLDEAMAIEDGDVVLVPRGYHPVRRLPWLRALLSQRHGRAEADLEVP